MWRGDVFKEQIMTGRLLQRDSKGRRSIWPFYIAYIVCMALFLRLLPGVSSNVFILCLSILVWLDLFFLRRRAAIVLLHPHARTLRLLGFALFILWMLLPLTYYSDDWIRHVYDGLQLVQGRPVYRLPPVDLPPPAGFDLLPNHAHRQTIYLPFTQLQAWLAGSLFYWLGGVVPARVIFAAVWSAVTVALFLLAWRRLSRRHRASLLSVMGTSPFLVFSASLHADVQGMFGALALLSGSSGMLAVILPLIKPEGIFITLQAWLDRTHKSRKTYYITACITLFFMAIFSFMILWPTKEDALGFFKQTQFFSNWWTAYHPAVYVLERLGYSVYDGQALYRLFLLPVFVLALTFFGFLHPGMRMPVRKPGEMWPLGMIFLALYFLWRITLHPWYFLWFVPFMILRGAHRILAFFPMLLLWYAVIPDYRAGQGWHEGTFFLVAGAHVAALLFIDRMRRIGLI